MYVPPLWPNKINTPIPICGYYIYGVISSVRYIYLYSPYIVMNKKVPCEPYCEGDVSLSLRGTRRYTYIPVNGTLEMVFFSCKHEQSLTNREVKREARDSLNLDVNRTLK